MAGTMRKSKGTSGFPMHRPGKFLPKLYGALTFVVIVLSALLLRLVDRTNGKIKTSGKTRRFYLHVPKSAQRSTPIPLVITFHGFAEWPAHVMRTSGWNKLADHHGFLVVYPSGSGTPKHWRTRGSKGTPDDPGLDVQFVKDLILYLEQKFNIDPSRIFINGFSNGGGISHLLACKMADKIAAFGCVSGALIYARQETEPGRPMPLIAFHGTADPIVPFDGGPSRSFEIPFPVVPDWMHNWAVLNGCEPSPVPIFNSAHVNGIRYDGSTRQAEVAFYTIDGGGHAWPGGIPLPKWLAGSTTDEINATELMWQFFSHHPLQP